jgi:hypothetical protein
MSRPTALALRFGRRPDTSYQGEFVIIAPLATCKATHKYTSGQRPLFGMSACCNAPSGGLNAPI